MHPETISGHPDRLKQVVRPSRVLTTTRRRVRARRSKLFDMLRKYTKIARDIDAPMPPETRIVCFDAMEDIETATARNAPPDVACHNDLLSENFIVDADGKMWVIDWEYGGMTDPFFDLGDFVMEHPFSREEERLIAATYCGGMDERLFGRMMLYKSVSGVWWGVWAMIQAHGLPDRLRLHGVGHGADGACAERRRRPRLPAVAGGTVNRLPAYAAKGGTA